MTHRPRTFTFYSYKGGVGRSMALLNVAYTLHSLGRHVLIVDFDLEAPGVSGFLRRNEELAPATADQPDVVDLLKEVVPLARWQLGAATQPAVPALTPYLREVKPEKFAPSQNPRFRRTRLDVLSASDERDYTNRLAALDAASLSAEDLAEMGNVLREIFFRHQFPWAWQPEDEDQPTRYDYILIDSRTGFTETSGLCIGPLADRLVIFCGLNDQNINGTAEFLKVVGLQAGPRSTPWDDADDIGDKDHAPRLGNKPSLLVASPVPHGDMGVKESRFRAMEDVLKIRPDHSISYHSRLSLMETVFLRDFPQELISREYRDLTDSILGLVRDSPRHLQALVQPPTKSDAPPPEPSTSTLFRYEAMLDEQGGVELAAPLRYVADQLSAQAAKLSGNKADALFASAQEKYRAVLVIKPDDHEALYNWGNALLNQARQRKGGEADALFAAAGEKYQAALAIKPDSHEALNNWGSALAIQALQKTGGDTDALFAAAGEKFQAALAIKPDKHEALNNWGKTLLNQARQKRGGEADVLYAAAGEKCQAVLAIKADDHDALNNWGTALLYQAQQKQGNEADAIFTAAGEKYKAALVIKPDKHEALYNLACLASLRRNTVEALGWLRKAILAGYPISQSKVTKDTDFDPIRDEKEFREFLAKLPPDFTKKSSQLPARQRPFQD